MYTRSIVTQLSTLQNYRTINRNNFQMIAKNDLFSFLECSTPCISFLNRSNSKNQNQLWKNYAQTLSLQINIKNMNLLTIAVPFLKLVSAIFIKFLFFHQMIALQNL